MLEASESLENIFENAVKEAEKENTNTLQSNTFFLHL